MYFEHEFGGFYKRKSTVMGDRIAWQVEGRGERSKKKMSCYKTLNQWVREDLNVTLDFFELPLRNLGLHSVFLLKIPGKEATT